MITNDTTIKQDDTQFSRDGLIAAMESILDNPTLDNMQSQLEGLSEAEKLHLKKLIDMSVVVRGQRLQDAICNIKRPLYLSNLITDLISEQQQGRNDDDQQ